MLQQPNSYDSEEYDMDMPIVDTQKIKGHFEAIMKIIEKKKQLPNFEDLKQNYNIKNYNIQKLQPTNIRAFHSQIIQKYMTKKLKRTWCENQLRLFVWILFYYQNAIDLEIQLYTERQWNNIANIFVNKLQEDCKFQWLSIRKESKSPEVWTNEQDQLLQQIILKHNSDNKWNEIAKELYKRSNCRYFRKPKQCRQHWRNYLDPQIQKGDWKSNQDQKLLELSIELGKKWSNISKQMKNRTEHSVKNRYKSLLKKYKKNQPKKPRQRGGRQTETESVTNIIKQIINSRPIVQKKQIITKQPLKRTTSKESMIRTRSNVGFVQCEKHQSKQGLAMFDDKNWIGSPTLLTPFSFNQKAKFGTMLFITSPRTKSPRFRNVLDWGDANKQEYFF